MADMTNNGPQVSSRGARKVRVGVVVSDKMQKTVVVRSTAACRTRCTARW